MPAYAGTEGSKIEWPSAFSEEREGESATESTAAMQGGRPGMTGDISDPSDRSDR